MYVVGDWYSDALWKVGQADKDGDGVISLDEFVDVCCTATRKTTGPIRKNRLEDGPKL